MQPRLGFATQPALKGTGGEHTRTNLRTTPLRPPRIGTILSTQHARAVLMAQQVDVAVLALQAAGGGTVTVIILLAVDEWAG